MALTRLRLMMVAVLAIPLLLGAAPAAAVLLPVDGGWQTFVFEDLGPVAPAGGYQLTALVPVEVRVVDCCIIGDEFRVTITPGTFFDTSDASAHDGELSGCFDGDCSWADGRLSKGSVVLSAGVYQIDIAATTLCEGGTRDCTGPKGGFIKAVTAAAVPEPGTLAMFGLGALVVARRCRRRGAS